MTSTIGFSYHQLTDPSSITSCCFAKLLKSYGSQEQFLVVARNHLLEVYKVDYKV